MTTGEERSDEARPRVWCRVCESRRRLRSLYWWDVLGAHFGECEGCGNTIRFDPAETGNS